MGIEREGFVGNPNKIDLVVDTDDDDGEYLSGDEIEFVPFVLPSDPDFIFEEGLDDISDDDDEDYDPADDYEDFLSDSDFIAEGSGESVLEDVEVLEELDQSADEAELPNASETAAMPNDTKSAENKISDETNSSVSARECDSDV